MQECQSGGDSILRSVYVMGMVNRRSPPVESMPRHQCLIYSGDPSDLLKALAATIREKLKQNYRCLYLNSPPMVARIRACLVNRGVNVDREIANSNLQLTSGQEHLVKGVFDPGRMLDMLKEAIASALADGHAGLWASGDMAWEFGPERDFTKLVEYELGLEDLLYAQPALCGVCQYCADTLPEGVVRSGSELHSALFINETLSRMNPHYIVGRSRN